MHTSQPASLSEDMKHAFMRGLIPKDFDDRSHEVDMIQAYFVIRENMRHSKQDMTCLATNPSLAWNCLVTRTVKWEFLSAMKMGNYSSSWQMRHG